MNTHNHKLHSFVEEPSLQMRACDYQQCGNEGLYKAPRSRTQMREYFWFCLQHVREYNRNWDFFAGMSEPEIEKVWRGIFTWERPTHKFGSYAFKDPLDILKRIRPQKDVDPLAQRLLGAEEKKALKIMMLSFPYTAYALKKRYKELVKRYHPDIHGGCPLSEEKLKTINGAYAILKNF